MYRGYHIVANTAAGRRRYMQWLVPYVLACPEIERYDIWVHTHNGADIEFFKQLAKNFPKVNLVWQPDGVVKDISTINAFYRFCCDEDTIYIKLDDDIPWMEPDAIRKMIDFRIDHPEYFLVSPLVINNAQCTYILQVLGKIKLNTYYNSNAGGANRLWNSGKCAADLHQWFLNNYLKTGKYKELYVGERPTALTRFSINNILWFGREMKELNGIIPGDDEEFLSCIYPTRLGRANCFNGNALIAHFAFFTQRDELDKKDILAQYGSYLCSLWKNDPVYGPINNKVQEIVKDVDSREAELLRNPSPYKKPEPPKYKYSLKDKLFMMLPKELKDAWIEYKRNHQPDTTDYVLE